MPVFISHKKEDTNAAMVIGQQLRFAGIRVYIDELDPETKNTEDITSLVLSRLNSCSHLIAVLSKKSQASWWIPFEIGAASNSHHRISSYKIEAMSEPEYLQKWPIMSQQNHLQRFINLYKVESSHVALSRRSIASDQSLDSVGEKNFHDNLKRYVKLGY